MCIKSWTLQPPNSANTKAKYPLSTRHPHSLRDCMMMVMTMTWIVQNYVQMLWCLVASIIAIPFCLILQTLTSINVWLAHLVTKLQQFTHSVPQLCSLLPFPKKRHCFTHTMRWAMSHFLATSAIFSWHATWLGNTWHTETRYIRWFWKSKDTPSKGELTFCSDISQPSFTRVKITASQKSWTHRFESLRKSVPNIILKLQPFKVEI